MPVDSAISAGFHRIYGDEFDNVLIGTNDIDLIFAYGGNDVLNGKGGVDVLFGGNGNDTYVVDNASDIVNDVPGDFNIAGYDHVKAEVSYALADGTDVEILETTLETGTIAIDLSGSNGSETVIGNNGVNLLLGYGGEDYLRGNGGTDHLEGGDGSDQLDGGAGADTMIGGIGNDNYFIDNTGDIVIEKSNEGFDSVNVALSFSLAGTNIESAAATEGKNVAVLTGSTDGNGLYGNSGVNTLIGDDGDDLLQGNKGQDFLSGGLGKDNFAYLSAPSSSDTDTIKDFTPEDDIFSLIGMFTGVPSGVLSANRFVLGTKAVDADDRVIYNQKAGALYIDVDGVGGVSQVLIAMLDNTPKISAADFTIL